MKQFDFQNDILFLKVKKSPLIVRIIFFIMSLGFFFIPVPGTAIAMSTGNGLKLGYFIGIAISLLGGFYMLRVSLWNTYGEEKIEIAGNKVIYEANYGWFKDGKKEIYFDRLSYSVKSIGYEEDNKGLLMIDSGEGKIESVVKMPIDELKELINLLEIMVPELSHKK
jgi:hypothetical protein